MARDSPWLGPIFYSDKPRTDDAGTFVNLYDIDRLFFSEVLQEWTYHAVKSWHIGVLHKTLKFYDGADIPGGHQEASPSAFKGDPEEHPGWESRRLYDNGLIKPDEESWFSFFRKDRWLNWNNNSPVLDGQPWSVDNPLVWDILSVSIELVNRILNALMDDEHPFLKVLLFGYLTPWTAATEHLSLDLPPPFPNATAIISYELYRQHRDKCTEEFSSHMEQLPQLGTRNIIERLEELLERQSWSFHDNDNSYGTTFPTFDSVIALQVHTFIQLIEGNVTLAERCILQFNLAVVILHEMGHAITNNRLRESAGEMKNLYWNFEPYIDFNGAAETGHRVDMAVWGCVFELGQRAGGMRPPLGMFGQNWPISDFCRSNNRGTFIPGHEEFAAGNIIQKDLVPAEFTSKLLSESFWDALDIPRKSDNFFHRTSMFVSKTVHDPGKEITSYMTPITLDQSLDIDQLTGTEKSMAQDWMEREALWDTVRAGWYQDNHDIWSETPWGKKYARWFLADFSNAHKKADIEICAGTADGMTSFIPWFNVTTRDEYIGHLENDDDRWVFHAIGLLMYASIPIRNNGHVSPYAINFEGPEHLVPSEEAERAGHPGIELTSRNPTGGRPVPPSRFVNPLKPEEQAQPNDFTHFYFLNRVLDIISHLATAQRQVRTGWLEEIMRVESILRQDHMARAQTALFAYEMTGAWSRSWDFEVPEYSPDSLSMWRDNEWVPV